MGLRYRRSAGATERTVGQSVFLANPEYGTVYRLNETGAALWRLLEEPTTLAEAAAVFRRAFPEAPADEIEQELDELLDALHEESLVEFDEGSASDEGGDR